MVTEKQRLANFSRRGKTNLKFETNLFIDNSPLNMWLLGLFASDGNMGIQNRGHIISFSGKIEDMKKIRNQINQGKVFIHKKLENYANLYFRDLRVYNRLLNLGMVPRKSKILIYPNIPQEIDIDRNFIRGFFEGDGWVSISSKISKNFHTGFCSGSKIFLIELKRRLFIYGIKSGEIYLKKTNSIKSFKGEVYILELSTLSSFFLYKFMYENITENIICMDKKNKFYNLIEKHKNQIKYITKSIYKKGVIICGKI